MTTTAETVAITPPSSPLDMPSQAFSQRPKAVRVQARSARFVRLARLLTFGGALVLTAVASWQMYLILPFHDATAAFAPPLLLWLLLVLFTLTFGWIALAATAAIAGLLLQPTSRLQAEPDVPLQGRTVLLMPIYNEEPTSICAALAAMGEELDRLGLQDHFEIFVVSDTNAQELLPNEMVAVQCLREQLCSIMPVWYRRRQQNTDRKPGNIRDFINRWGNGYDYMVVLDADSLIAAETLATMVREMDADSNAGILQTLPRVYGGETLFARLQQFSGAAYGAVFARGLCAWQGQDGNYWGHNAIIRIRAFAESAGLPSLRGPSPFGGEIRSHDFVEAALIRRTGWGVRMLPDISGSWEECPPTLLDAAIRDRRWSQGNIQHLSVVAARGLRWPSRVHMMMGVMNYLTSLFWLALVTIGLVLSAQFVAQHTRGAQNTTVNMLDAERMIGLFALTLTILLLPKLLGLAAGLLSRERRGGLGRLKFFFSAVLELMFSILQAPIFMLIHSRHLWEIACGQDSGWSVQQRRANSLPWRKLLLGHGFHTVAGLILLGLFVTLPSSLMFWTLPMALGLVLAIPLSALSGSKSAGRSLARVGLFCTQEELAPPEIIKRREALLSRFGAAIEAAQPDPLALRSSAEIYHLYGSYDEKRPRYGRL